MRYSVILLCALLPSCVAIPLRSSEGRGTGRTSADSTAVVALQHGWADALFLRDSLRLREILADDFRTTTAEGSVIGREQDIAPVLTGGIKFESARIDSLTVDVYDNAAIARGIFVYVVRAGDRTLRGRERFTETYVRRSGQWQVVASHNTALP